jgi:hypothetical protein
MNVANIIGGPALVTYGGASLYSKDVIRLIEAIETFEVGTDPHGKADDRELNRSVLIEFTPAGVWDDLAVLFPYANPKHGDLVTPVRTFGTVTAGDDDVEILDHRLRAGMAVKLSTSAADLPAGLDTSTLYYIGTPDDDTVTFHLTRAAAIANTSLVDITDAGTGVHKLIMQEPLVIHAFSGFKRTYHNAAVVQQPQIIASATKTMLGPIRFEAFLRNEMAPGDANSLYTDTDVAFTDASFDPDGILTLCHAAEWGSSPWDDISTKEGWTIEPTVELEAVETDCLGIVSRRIVGAACNASAQILGLSEAQISAAKLLQGSGAGRGRSLSGDSLIISGTGTYIALYGASLVGGPQQFGAREDRAGDHEWRANAQWTSGVRGPLFFVGTAAP